MSYFPKWLKRVLILNLIFFSFSFSFAGPKWQIDDDSWLSLAFLGQVHYSFLDGAADEDDFYLRRGRLILAGQINSNIKFFMETDNDNLGKAGTSVSTDIQDAFVDIRLGQSEHWVEFGLILLPFSFEGTSSAASLLGNDYNSEIMKLTNSFVWRDMGAMFHGHHGDKFAYKVGFFDGYEASNKNPDADLRITGHLAFNLVGAVETGWFASQNRLKDSSYLSIGLGVDSQGKATLGSSGAVDSDAFVVDFQSAYAFSGKSLTLNGGYYDWDSSSFVGNTACLEAGLAFTKTQVTAKYSLQDMDNGGEVADTTIGFFYFAKKHNSRFGVEYRTGDSADWLLAGLQFLL